MFLCLCFFKKGKGSFLLFWEFNELKGKWILKNIFEINFLLVAGKRRLFENPSGFNENPANFLANWWLSGQIKIWECGNRTLFFSAAILEKRINFHEYWITTSNCVTNSKNSRKRASFLSLYGQTPLFFHLNFFYHSQYFQSTFIPIFSFFLSFFLSFPFYPFFSIVLIFSYYISLSKIYYIIYILN